MNLQLLQKFEHIGLILQFFDQLMKVVGNVSEWWIHLNFLICYILIARGGEMQLLHGDVQVSIIGI